MAQTPDETPRPSQAEGEPTPGSGKQARDKAPRPSQAEGEGGQPQHGSAGAASDVGGRSRVQHGEQFRAGQTEPSAGAGGAQPTPPRPSQAEGELDPGSTGGGKQARDKAPRPSQAEGEDRGRR